jgi:alkaline phosphatase D
LPLEKQKMYDLIKTTGANGVFFLSGDVHFAEFTKTQPAGWYPIYDFTSSGITHHEDKVASRNNAIRVGNGYQYVNFGFINNRLESKSGNRKSTGIWQHSRIRS